MRGVTLSPLLLPSVVLYIESKMCRWGRASIVTSSFYHLQANAAIVSDACKTEPTIRCSRNYNDTIPFNFLHYHIIVIDYVMSLRVHMYSLTTIFTFTQKLLRTRRWHRIRPFTALTITYDAPLDTYSSFILTISIEVVTRIPTFAYSVTPVSTSLLTGTEPLPLCPQST